MFKKTISPEEIDRMFFNNNTRFRKDLGQNYIIDTSAIEETLANISEKIETIVEIGPGIGNLTLNYFNKYKAVILIEYDSKKIPILTDNLKKANNNVFPEWVKIVNEDILKVDLCSYVKNDYQILGALPYNISKPIIEKILFLKIPPIKSTLILQKEVVEKYCGNPRGSFLNTFITIFAKVKARNIILRDSFYPIPKIDSQVITITEIKQMSEKEMDESKRLVEFIRVSYSNPRKKLRNNITLKSIQNNLTQKRPEELTLKEWEELFNLFKIQQSV